MNYGYCPIEIPLFASALILLFLLIYTVRRPFELPVLPFSLVVLAFLEWTLAYIFEIAAETLELKLLWANIQFIGIGAAPILWFILVRSLTGRHEIPWKSLAAVSIVPLLTLALAFTGNGHELFRGSPSLVHAPRALLLFADYGPWHNWVFLPYQYILYGLSLVNLLNGYGTVKNPYRRQYLLLFFITLVPLIGSALYILSVPPFEHLNPVPILFTLSSLLLAKAVYSHHTFEIVPVARDTVIENMKDTVLVFDKKNRFIDYNPAAESLFPHITPESIGNKAEEVFENEHKLLEQLTSLEEEKEIDFRSGENSSGKQRHYRSCCSLLRSSQGKRLGTILSISDITSQVDLMQEMERLATTDELTELHNRRAFFQEATMEMERARRYGRPISFILIDLDHFKRINDNYGHAAGDTVLKEITRRIRTSIRDMDIAGRYGGEEFAVCLPETRQETAEALAERLRSIIASDSVYHEGKKLQITASFGIIGKETIDEETLEGLFAKADKALYLAKEKGRNICIPFTY